MPPPNQMRKQKSTVIRKAKNHQTDGKRSLRRRVIEPCMEVEDELRQWYLSPPSPLEVTRPSSSSSSPGDEPSPSGRLAPQRQRAGGIVIRGAENNIMDDPPHEIVIRENHHLPSSGSSEDEGVIPGAYADRTHSTGQPFSLNVQRGHREDEYEHEDEHHRQSSSLANQENHARLGNDSSIRGLDGSTRSNARRRKSASNAQLSKKDRSNSSRQRDFDGSDAQRNPPSNNLSRSMNNMSLKSIDNSSMALSTRNPTNEKHNSNASATSKSSSHSSGKKSQKKPKNPREGTPRQNSVTSTPSNVNNGMAFRSTSETSYKPISSTTSKSEGGAPSLGGMSPEKSILRRDVTSNGENIVITGSNKPKERRPSQPQSIRESEQPQKEKYESPAFPTVENASLSPKKRGGLSSSITSRIQRCLKPFKPGKRRQNNQAKEGQNKDMVKTNPYALDESEPASDFSHTLVSTVEKHDICMAANSRAYSEAHERGVPNPPSLIIASDGSTKKGDLISSMNSSSHHLHQSLHSISEHDVLHEARVRPKLGNHSSHSDGGIRGRDALRYSTHSEGGARGMANTTNFGLSHSHHGFTSPTNKRHGTSNLDSSFTDVSMTGTIMTSYSTTFKAPVALNGIYSKNLASLAPDDDSTHIINAPWAEDPGAGDDIGASDHTNRIQGKYSGPVNSDSLQPHGEGALVIMDHTFYGTWKGGKLISHLTAEPEAKGGSDSNGDRRGSMETSADDLPQNSLHSSLHSLEKSQHSIAHSNISSLPVDEIINKGVDIKYVINKIGKPESIADEVTSMGHPRLYGIGDGCRTPNDMIIQRTDKKAIQSTALLKKWDQAFIKRSNGVWTVAFMIDRALQPKHISRRRRDCARWCTVWEIDPRSMELEESMLFVINDDGATKIINKKCWGKYVRRMKK